MRLFSTYTKQVFIVLFMTTTLFSLDFDSEFAAAQEEMLEMEAEFERTKLAQQNEFKTYSETLQKEYDDYKNEINEFWRKPELSSKRKWVSYSEDKQSRSKVDFQNNVIIIEVIAPSQKKAEEKIKQRLGYVVSKNTQEVVETDPLQRRIAQLKRQIPVVIDVKPILQNVIFEKQPTKNDVMQYTKNTVKKNKIKVRTSKLEHKNVYTMTVPLPKDTMLRKSKEYESEIVKNAQRFSIPIPLVFAIMHTESNFNPFAKSHIPAFGLMQIVPRSAGRDVYQYLFKKKGQPTASYLYNGANNIEMGSTYLYILYYRYLRKIKNPESRLYCSIAAYNTGAGNIAWAFTRKNNMNRAAPKINAMTPDEVYQHLLENLKYDEPKHYLRRVKKRMSAYKKAYNL